MKTTDLKIGDIVCFKTGLKKDKLSIPMTVVGIFSSFHGISPKDTVYLDFDGNEGDVLEEEVQDLVFYESKYHYYYVYIATKNEIQEFPDEIKHRKGDYYEGNFIFKDGYGFTKYKIPRNEIDYFCNFNGHLKGSSSILNLNVYNISDSIYIDLIKNYIDTEDELVVLLEKEGTIRCVYSKNGFNRKMPDMVDGKHSILITALTPCFMPYLKTENLKVIKEVQ